MATFTKRKGPMGIRWTARVRRDGRKETKTFPTRALAETWARSQEIAIESGEYVAPNKSTKIWADAVDAFIEDRKSIKRAPGPHFAYVLERLKRQYGLESLNDLTVEFWSKHLRIRMAEGVLGSTAASDLAYVSAVLHWCKRKGWIVDATAPGTARSILHADGVKVTSRERTRRVSDDEIKKLLTWMKNNPNSIPLYDITQFALATGMRKQEILDLKFDDITGRVVRIKRKDPVDRNRYEEVPLLHAHDKWPQVDPLEIIERQKKPSPTSRVFPYPRSTVGWSFANACKAVGLKGVTIHVLRHECLSRLSERGFDLLWLMKIASHRDPRSSRRYVKISAETLANLK